MSRTGTVRLVCVRGLAGSPGVLAGLVSVAVLVSPAPTARPQDAPLKLGEVIERVVCLDDASQSYALFLPTAYTKEREWPILYVFDPQARGRVPVALFSRAAERLGVIVVSSNNSRNGPMAPVLAATEAVWRDTHARLTLDPDRIYAAGMSGGTLPALVLGTRYGAGVIACAGAGDASQIPPVDARFAWLGIAGDADFNFERVKGVVEALSARGVTARFATFDGGHGWPPEDLAGQSLAWLDLLARRDGRRARDEARLDELYAQGLARARDLAARGHLDDAAEELQALAREFRGLRPVEALSAEAARLRDTPEAARERKEEKALAERHRQQATQLEALRWRMEQRASAGPRVASDGGNLSDLNDALEAAESDRRELERQVERLGRERSSQDVETRLLARRVLDGFYLGTFYAGLDRRDQRKFDAALLDFDLCSRIRPQNPMPAYEAARTHAARGDRKKAVSELKRAIALGFTDVSRLGEDPEWEKLRDRPELKAVLDELRSRPQPTPAPAR